MKQMITIIVPIYNVERYLRQCLNSIMNQTYKDFSVILVNDGSTDHCEEICKEYCEKDRRFTYCYQTNQGLGPARHMGINLAKTDWITFVDSDDWIEDCYIEKFEEKIQENETDIIYCDTWIAKENGGVLIYNASRSNVKLARLSLKEQIELADNCAMHGAVYKKELWTRTDIRMPEIVYEDSAVYGNLLLSAKSVSYISDALYYYRKGRSDSLMTLGRTNPDNMYNALLYHMEFYRKTFPGHRYDKTIQIYLQKKLVSEARRCKIDSFYQKAFNLLKEFFPEWHDMYSAQMMAVGSYMTCMVYNNMAWIRQTEHLNYVFTSIISMVAPDVKLDQRNIIGSNAYRISMVQKEARKEWKNNLANCKWLLFDLLEERNDLIAYKGSYLTKSEAFDECIELTSDMHIISRDSMAVWNLWKSAFKTFIMNLRDHDVCPIMLELYLSEQYGHMNHMKNFEEIDQIRKRNSMLKQYYAYVKETYPEIRCIKLGDVTVWTDENFLYGCKPWHYNGALIKRLESSVREIIN